MGFWKVVRLDKKFIDKIKKPTLIVGLPGVGNVAKLTVDLLVKELKAKPIIELESDAMPSSVKINKDNLIELPHIYIYEAFINKQYFLFLAGDFQPLEEVVSVDFSITVLKIFKKLKGKEIITLAGIGLPTIPKKPKIYCTSYSKKLVDSFNKSLNLKTKIYNVVGSVIGASGLLVGFSEKKNVNAVLLLVETYGHPLFLGVDSARSLLKLLNKKFGFNVNPKLLKHQQVTHERIVKTQKSREGANSINNINYIG